MRMFHACLLLTAALALAACVGGDSPATTQNAGGPSGGDGASGTEPHSAADADDTAKNGPGSPAEAVEEPAVNLANPGEAVFNQTAPDVFRVRFVTSKGPFVVEVKRDWAPHGADRFYSLVSGGYYDDVRFYRVISGFMAQFGMHGDPAVNTAWADANIPDDPVLQSNARGMLSFATRGPNTRTTQLFINFVDNSGLDGMGFSPFARVVDGMSVVDSLYSGYGEGAPRGLGPSQALITSQGNEYLDGKFPQLDKVITARIE